MSKATTILSILSFIIFTNACTPKPDFEVPSIDVNALEIDFKKWSAYHNENISLISDFVPLDAALNPISKDAFLKSLVRSKYIPLKLHSNTDKTYYTLHELSRDAHIDIKVAMISSMHSIYSNFQKEGTTFPNFDFEDIEGNKYNQENLKGKTLVLKTWFINCLPCIQEFPELNEMVEHYKDNTSLSFISLALDAQPDLVNFLKNKKFDYPVVADQSNFIKDDLQVQSFPSHYIIENGIVQKVTNSAKELISLLKQKYP